MGLDDPINLDPSLKFITKNNITLNKSCLNNPSAWSPFFSDWTIFAKFLNF